jgi:hypothetical protein
MEIPQPGGRTEYAAWRLPGSHIHREESGMTFPEKDTEALPPRAGGNPCSGLVILGDHPFAKNPAGKLKSRIATIFPGDKVLITLPGIHGTQRMAYVDWLERHRREQSLPAPSREEQLAAWNTAVDLIIEDGTILIRPDPENMALAFEADLLLQRLAPKHRIKYLHVADLRVRRAIKHRGQCWRIAPLPKSPEEMKAMIASSRIGIDGQEIYYYNKSCGTRILTCDQLATLGELNDEELRRHLVEIRSLAEKLNPAGYPEVRFFMGDGGFTKLDFEACDPATLDGPGLRAAHLDLVQKFREAVGPAYCDDDLDNIEWRHHMFAALIDQEEETVSEELLAGLSSEFFMQIEWLPGGRIENGELILDTVFQLESAVTDDPELTRLICENARKLILNFVREHGDLEYVNIGRVIGSLSRERPADRGRREVYIAQVKRLGDPQEMVTIIRFQKWGVREHLNRNKGLLEAMIRSEEYTDYVLNRRLGCRQLGMNLPARVMSKKIIEHYPTDPGGKHGFMIWSPYFERDYIRGIASDKLPVYKLRNPEYAQRLATLLGRAAASNLIVGRTNLDKHVLFDDGDEVVIEDSEGLPREIIVSDQTGTFTAYGDCFEQFAAAYAAPINRRAPDLLDLNAFADAYLDAFVAKFLEIQQAYRDRRGAFDTLFKHQPLDPNGNFAFRWQAVLRRLDGADPLALRALVEKHRPFLV